MKIYVTAALVALIGLICFPAQAQTKKLRWSDFTCDYEGTFNARKYSEAKMKDTAELVSITGLPLETDATAFDYAEIAKLNVAALDREYELKHDRLKNLDIVNVPYFQALRQKKLKELEQFYGLARTTMLAYQKPSVISDYRRADACVLKYAAPLTAGGEDLLGIWRVVNEESRKKNSDPQRVERIFNERMNSADREKFARLEVMAFGWWNCANEFIEYVDDDGAADKEFKKLFTRVKTLSCDEP